MRTYYLFLKSCSEAPDYEERYEAKNKKEAVEYFFKKFKKDGWTKKEIAKNVLKASF